MEKQKKIAVILSGCGRADGSEIHEATLTLYSIMKNGAIYEIFAPDILQHHAINHITGVITGETRNVLVESARIARGKIKPLSLFNAADFDSLIIPGGQGASKNLCSYAFDETGYTVNEEVKNAILGMRKLDKPMGALCIAPVILAKVLGKVEITLGQDKVAAKNVEKLGAKHVPTNHGEIVVDKALKVVTTPCYMLDANIVNIADGIDNLVKALLTLM
jgi:enhancing lycopene biosynthesis protein 2